MRAGQLRGSIAIQRKVQVGVDTLNAAVFTWQTWREPFSSVEVRRGREHFDIGSKQRFSEEVYRFCVRYDEVTGIDASMRVEFEAEHYDIKAILPNRLTKDECIIECTLQGSILEGKPLLGSIKQQIPTGHVGVAFPGLAISAEGGLAPYAFVVVSGVLPAGLTLDLNLGRISGTPTAAGTSAGIVFRVVDANSDRHELPAISLQVDP